MYFARKSKFLIFSDYTESFAPVCQILKENNIPFGILRGNARDRQELMQNYKTKSTQVIFINSSIDCAGINLQETTDIILYHNMATTTKNQIVARAERVGRNLPLHVHQLVT